MRINIVSSFLLLTAAFLPGSVMQPGQAGLLAARAAPFDYGSYSRVLSVYVNGEGLVNYEGLSTDTEFLDDFLADLAVLRTESFRAMGRDAQLALLINAYNAFVLKAVCEHYPAGRRLLAFFYPENSVKQIPGFFDRLEFTLLGRRMSLDELYHRILRGQYGEPRVHFALVWAARGCAPLRDGPYTGAALDTLLDSQARRFLRDPGKFVLDREDNLVRMSPIFEWYGEDFITARSGESPEEPDPKAVQRGALEFVSQYLGEEDRAFIRRGFFEVEYLDFDWSLNER